MLILKNFNNFINNTLSITIQKGLGQEEKQGEKQNETQKQPFPVHSLFISHEINLIFVLLEENQPNFRICSLWMSDLRENIKHFRWTIKVQFVF